MILLNYMYITLITVSVYIVCMTQSCSS